MFGMNSDIGQAEFDIRRNCPYLDTIRRPLLDFDFEKICSVTLSNINVYACLVCGKYFQGRGKTSIAYFHSLEKNHHVYMNLKTLNIHCLPDDYEIIDSSLRDIKAYLKPKFTTEIVENLDRNTSYSIDLSGKNYLPGFVGLNNIKANDYVNVVVHALTHVSPFRDHFIREENYCKYLQSPLVASFGELTRKIWNPKLFKAQVSPHELLQAVLSASEKKYVQTKQSDAMEFMTWFLMTLHKDLSGTGKTGSSIIHQIFQGEVRVHTKKLKIKKERDENESVNNNEFDTKSARKRAKIDIEAVQETIQRKPFIFLTLDLPPPPLFVNEFEKISIPQVALGTLLSKFDGETLQEVANEQRTYKLLKLPNFLVFHIKRFVKQNWTEDRNPTIVNFPIKNVEMREYLENANPNESYKYDLLANICLDTKQKSFKVHLRNKVNDQWFEMQDLLVQEIMPQVIFLPESYIQIWERQSSWKKGKTP